MDILIQILTETVEGKVQGGWISSTKNLKQKNCSEKDQRNTNAEENQKLTSEPQTEKS